MFQPSVMDQLTSFQCRMTSLSTAIQMKQKKIHRALNKVKNMLSTNPDIIYMAPEVLLELIRHRLVKLTPKMDKMIQMFIELENMQKELHSVIMEYDKFLLVNM